MSVKMWQFFHVWQGEPGWEYVIQKTIYHLQRQRYMEKLERLKVGNDAKPGWQNPETESIALCRLSEMVRI